MIVKRKTKVKLRHRRYLPLQKRQEVEENAVKISDVNPRYDLLRQSSHQNLISLKHNRVQTAGLHTHSKSIVTTFSFLQRGDPCEFVPTARFLLWLRLQLLTSCHNLDESVRQRRNIHTELRKVMLQFVHLYVFLSVSI